MAISYNEDHVGRGGTNAGADDNSDTRSWWIKTSSKLIDKPQIEEDAFSTGALPRPYVDRHPNNSFMLCKSLEIRQQDDKGGRVWRATARYDTKPLSKEDKDKEEEPNPLLRAAVYSGGFERDQQAITENVEGDLIKNSAGDVYLDPVTKPRTRLRIKGRMNVDPDAIPSWFFDLKDKTNEAEYVRGGRTFPEQTLLFIPGEISEPQEENETTFVVIHWELEFKEDNWKEKRIDNGFNELIDDASEPGGKRKAPIEVDGARPTEPQLLHDGKKIAQSSIEAGLFVVLEWQTIETGDFNQLP